MSEPNKQQFGDGGDNYGEAAQKVAEAAKQAGKATAEKAAASGAEATANAAAATVKAGVEGGKAVAEIASGTAAGGPWGAIIAAAWAMRHTLFKILICICLVLLFFITAVISLPSIIFNNIFHTDPDTVDPNASTDMYEIADDMADVVADCIQKGYDSALSEVERIIEENGYDYEASMDALINYGSATPDYDICYVFAAYSASMEQKGTSAQDMKSKLNNVASEMFKVTYVEKTFERVVSSDENPGDPDSTPSPETETVRYAECTIHPFDQNVINRAFSIDPGATYGQFQITYAQAIENMANALKLTLYGSLGAGDIPVISDAELLEILNNLTCSETRKLLIKTALSLVGRVPYFWGGKSAAGWNDEWNTPKLVTSSGSTSSGTIRPYGLDCSGFTDWVYRTAGLGSISAGSSNQWSNSTAITAVELLPGDLGFKAKPGDPGTNHVLMYVGKDSSGKMLWVHCSSSAGGVVLNSPSYVKYFRRPNGKDLESNIVPGGEVTGTPLYSSRVQVTHYCACSKCCGANANGITASGKHVASGMVAMSSHYPFGTQLMIDGILYTVEDRGGSGIENDISRVDIYVPDHQEALRLGRYWTNATFYRIGR